MVVFVSAFFSVFATASRPSWKRWKRWLRTRSSSSSRRTGTPASRARGSRAPSRRGERELARSLLPFGPRAEPHVCHVERGASPQLVRPEASLAPRARRPGVGLLLLLVGAPATRTAPSTSSKYATFCSTRFVTGLWNLYCCQPLPCFLARRIRSRTNSFPSGSLSLRLFLPTRSGFVGCAGSSSRQRRTQRRTGRDR